MHRGAQTGKIAVDLILAIVLLVAVWDAWPLPDQARFMPIFIAGVTLVFLAISIVIEASPTAARYLSPSTPRSDATSTEQAEQPAEWSVALRVIAYVALFWSLIFFFGFYAVPPVLVTLYLIFEGNVGPLVAIPCALLASALTLLGLDMLGVAPWIGAGPELIEDYVGGAVMPLF